MNATRQRLAAGMAMALALMGCAESTGPRTPQTDATLSGTVSTVSQDRAQLEVAGVTSSASKGIFSIGWKKFVGPNITEGTTIGEAYVVVQSETSTTRMRRGGIDIGTVTLNYPGGSVDVTKRVTPDGKVLYETFGKGRHHDSATPVNIPFVAGGTYTFAVTGAEGFTGGMFQITAPTSLLTIKGHANGDTVSKSADLNIGWTGGSSIDSVLIRVVPHLRREQMEPRELHDRDGGHDGHMGGEGPKGHREGPFMVGGPMEGMGPEFQRGLVVMVANTGSYIVSAADLGTLLNGTEAAELMVGVAQVEKQTVTHDGNELTILLRNGDRLVLHAK
jgi:hypothetical protein